jgi:hypothetical protein
MIQLNRTRDKGPKYLLITPPRNQDFENVSGFQGCGIVPEVSVCHQAKLPVLQCFGVGFGTRHFVGELFGVSGDAQEHTVHYGVFGDSLHYLVDLLRFL